MKKITLEVTDDIYNDLARVAKADRRRLNDLVIIILAEGLNWEYKDSNLYIDRLDSEFTPDEKKELKKNPWSSNRKYVNPYLDTDKFLKILCNNLKQLVYDDSFKEKTK
tara:strand:+ start:776 stop:1102 length:327 start_codon:yes stop_codon:yes gene_type:complete